MIELLHIKFPKGDIFMNNNYPQIQELLHQRADFQARLNLLPYDGTPEIKDREGNKYRNYSER